MFDFPQRIACCRQQMTAAGLDVLLLSVGADLLYLTGYTTKPLPRLTMLVLPADGDTTLLVPELEAPRVGDGPFRCQTWKETDDPLALVARLVGGGTKVAIGDQTWSSVLLGLQERLPHVTFESATPLMGSLRIKKDLNELAALAMAGAAADRVVARLGDERFAGRTESELSRLVANLTVEEGHERPSFWIVAGPSRDTDPTAHAHSRSARRIPWRSRCMEW
jgi:Xaa-Pro aminopeptidase